LQGFETDATDALVTRREAIAFRKQSDPSSGLGNPGSTAHSFEQQNAQTEATIRLRLRFGFCRVPIRLSH
jgi:hypothetical protein